MATKYGKSTFTEGITVIELEVSCIMLKFIDKSIPLELRETPFSKVPIPTCPERDTKVIISAVPLSSLDTIRTNGLVLSNPSG